MHPDHGQRLPCDAPQLAALTNAELAEIEGGGSLLDQAIKVIKVVYEIATSSGGPIA